MNVEGRKSKRTKIADNKKNSQLQIVKRTHKNHGAIKGTS